MMRLRVPRLSDGQMVDVEMEDLGASATDIPGRRSFTTRWRILPDGEDIYSRHTFVSWYPTADERMATDSAVLREHDLNLVADGFYVVAESA